MPKNTCKRDETRDIPRSRNRPRFDSCSNAAINAQFRLHRGSLEVCVPRERDATNAASVAVELDPNASILHARSARSSQPHVFLSMSISIHTIHTVSSAQLSYQSLALL